MGRGVEGAVRPRPSLTIFFCPSQPKNLQFLKWLILLIVVTKESIINFCCQKKGIFLSDKYVYNIQVNLGHLLDSTKIIEPNQRSLFHTTVPLIIGVNIENNLIQVFIGITCWCNQVKIYQNTVYPACAHLPPSPMLCSRLNPHPTTLNSGLFT